MKGKENKRDEEKKYVRGEEGKNGKNKKMALILSVSIVESR